MSEFKIVEHDGCWLIALYIGELKGDDLPAFSNAGADPNTDWFFLSDPLQGQGIGPFQKVIGKCFDTEQEARQFFQQHERELRAKAAPNTAGP